MTGPKLAYSHRALAAAACGPERELGLLPLKAPYNSPTVSGSSPSKRKRRGRMGTHGRHGVMTTDDITTATTAELVLQILYLRNFMNYIMYYSVTVIFRERWIHVQLLLVVHK